MMRFIAPFIIASLFLATGAFAQSADDFESRYPDWETNWEKRTIDLAELKAGGPPRDGIPSIDEPNFVSPQEAGSWLQPQEPVMAIHVDGDARAYPLQIMTFHEIVNDVIAGEPVAVTFCPLCYSAVAFKSTIDGEVYSFGVSGLLRHSDLVMYDRTTESLWQQVTGEAIVGDWVGTTLEQVPVQIISFEQFADAFPDGIVLSRDTGHSRPYGQNPYAGYDDINQTPILYDGPTDKRLPPMEKVVTLYINGESKAYPYTVTREERVIQDEVGGQNLVVFHADGAVSALDDRRISESREIGSTGVFDPHVDGQQLTFRYEGGHFVDEQTGSTWSIAGTAVEGPLEGAELTRLAHGDYFAFAWFAFRPETAIYQRAE